jgi:hypothetical protein
MAWLSFFQRRRFFPVDEKQNDMNLGSVVSPFSWDVTEPLCGVIGP